MNNEELYLNNEELSKLNNKEIKAIVDKINIKENIKNKKLYDFINVLKKDKRKNVILLGEKINKNIGKILKEINRIKGLYSFDKSFGNYKYVAGVDEVGRGPLAGPIVACSVILDLDVLDEELILELNDSKKLSKEKREVLSEIIKEKALAYEISLCTNKEIDEKGIAYCNNYVFLESCNSLKIKPDLVLSDGYLVKGINIENKSVIKGDTKSASIAAASIVAKVYRDKIMKDYAVKYPYYAFEENSGYGTVKHVDAIKEFGYCDIHRKSFLTKILG